MKLWILLGLALLWTPLASAQDRWPSLYDPHPIPADQPWLEGWYTRIVDPEWGGSVAVLVGTCSAPGGVPQPGYAAVLIQRPGSSRLEVHEAFPRRTEHRLPSGHVLRRPRVTGVADFTWSAPVGRFGPWSIEITLPDGVSLEANFEQPVSWKGGGPDRGPEGLLVHLPWLTQHWFVHSVASRARYTLRVPGRPPRAGRGWAHQEKNWGSDFPRDWTWAQGLRSAPGEEGFAQLALAGGEVQLQCGEDEGLRREGWLVGLRLGGRRFGFRAPGDRCRVERDPAAGTFTLHAEGGDQRVAIRIEAPPDSFAEVSVPTAIGFRRGAVESFRARAEVEAWERDEAGRWARVGQATIEGVALEFGALDAAGD